MVAVEMCYHIIINVDIHADAAHTFPLWGLLTHRLTAGHPLQCNSSGSLLLLSGSLSAQTV